MSIQDFTKYILMTTLALTAGYFLLYQKNPCTSTITYKIGTFDSRFGISQQDFLAVIEEASLIWEKPIEKDLFTYDPEGDVTINLIYDSRQKTTQTNAQLHTDALKISQLASSVKAQFLALEDKRKLREEEYVTMVARFEEHQNTYSDQVTYWNDNGGAPEKEYTMLMNLKEDLTAERAILERKRLEVNTLVEQINIFIRKYNLLVSDANENINTINLSAGKEFEEGLYDPNKNEINIYEFSTNKKLLRVVTHELGHALYLPHNDNPQSIMYALNQANTLTLSKEDLEALKTKCKLP